MSKQLMKGNEALAEAALRAGCRFYSGYPITPQTEILEYLAKRMDEAVSNRKTNAANKTDVEACRWAALSALKAFQESAKERGANAVVDIVSFYKKNEFRHDTNFECFAGNVVAGVALKGTYAKVN